MICLSAASFSLNWAPGGFSRTPYLLTFPNTVSSRVVARRTSGRQSMRLHSAGGRILRTDGDKSTTSYCRYLHTAHPTNPRGAQMARFGTGTGLAHVCQTGHLRRLRKHRDNLAREMRRVFRMGRFRHPAKFAFPTLISGGRAGGTWIYYWRRSRSCVARRISQSTK